MIFPEELKHLKLYKRPLKLPINMDDKKHGSLIMLLTPNSDFINTLMKSTPYILNSGKKFESFYLEKDITLYINTDKKTMKESLVSAQDDKMYNILESNINKETLSEGTKSNIDKDFKPKGNKNLSSFKKIHITENVINKYKKEYPILKHVRCKDTKQYICDGYIWFDNDNLVCTLGSCEYTDDHTKWIVSLEIIPEYKGYGLSKQLLDYATKNMNCSYLSVNKNNKLAKNIYDKYGFKVYQEDNTMYYMYYGNKAKNIVEEACKNRATARQFVSDVDKLAKKYDANYFIVTDGASKYSNTGNPAVKNARDSQIEWEKKNGFDPDEDWSDKVKNGIYNESSSNTSKHHLYFYHYIPKSAKLNPGIVSPKYMYEHKMTKEFNNSTDKYRDRLVNGWDYYPNKNTDELTAKEIFEGINKFRKSEYGLSYIYFFRYPLYPELGPKIKEFLRTHDCYRIDLNDLKTRNEITDIYWGTENSSSDGKPLNLDWYKNITYDDYFKDYDDNAIINFAAMNHIGIRFKKDYCPANLLTKYNSSSKIIQEELSSKERNKLPDSEFGLPKQRKYPLHDQEHVLSAIKFFNYCDDKHKPELAKNIIKKINKLFDEGEKVNINVGAKNSFNKYWKDNKFIHEDNIINESIKDDLFIDKNINVPPKILNLAKKIIKNNAKDAITPTQVIHDPKYAKEYKSYIGTLVMKSNYFKKHENIRKAIKFVVNSITSFPTLADTVSGNTTIIDSSKDLEEIKSNYTIKGLMLGDLKNLDILVDVRFPLMVVPKKKKAVKEEYEDDNVVDSLDSDIKSKMADNNSDNLIKDIMKDNGIILLDQCVRKDIKSSFSVLEIENRLPWIKYNEDIVDGYVYFSSSTQAAQLLIACVLIIKVEDENCIVLDINHNNLGAGLSKQLLDTAIKKFNNPVIYVANTNLSLKIMLSYGFKVVSASDSMVKLIKNDQNID